MLNRDNYDLQSKMTVVLEFSVAHNFLTLVHLAAHQPTLECVLAPGYLIVYPFYQRMLPGTHIEIYNYIMILCKLQAVRLVMELVCS